jgi:hypothetical protein
VPQICSEKRRHLIEIGAGLLADQQFVGHGCWKCSRDQPLAGARSLVTAVLASVPDAALGVYPIRLCDAASRATRLAKHPRSFGSAATPAGFEPEYGPNRFADLQKSIEKLRVPLGAVGIAWRRQKAVQVGPEWARGARATRPGYQPDGVAGMDRRGAQRKDRRRNATPVFWCSCLISSPAELSLAALLIARQVPRG